jgi:uncharacterized membrane-anchored protein
MKTDYIDSLINGGLNITNKLVILLVSVSVVWFIWNVIKYTMSTEDADKTKAKDQMIRGIIAITVSVSIWGLVAILQTMFNTGGKSAPSDLNNMIPGVSVGGSSGGSLNTSQGGSISGGGQASSLTFPSSGSGSGS